MRNSLSYDQKTEGVAVAVKKAFWWMEGHGYMCNVKIKYTVQGKDYYKRVLSLMEDFPPVVGNTFIVTYCSDKPSKAKVKRKPMRERINR